MRPAIIIAAIVVAGLAVAGAARIVRVTQSDPPPNTATPLPAVELVRFPTQIHRPDGPPRLTTDQLDQLGRPISIACSTCHTTRTPNLNNATTADLDEFHQDLTIKHASLTCLSCHNADDYDALQTAGGHRIEFQNVMALCAQCHGTKYRDYQHGAHGGMSGYWDPTRGPKLKNNCIDCHDPHAPAYPHMTPTFKAIDRFLNTKTHEETADGH